MTKAIIKNDIFGTPESVEELQAWCEQHAGDEKSVAMTAAGMAWNLAASLVSKSSAEAPRLEKGNYLSVVAGSAEVIIKHDDNGVAVDIWPIRDNHCFECPVGSTWVTHNELQEDE